MQIDTVCTFYSLSFYSIFVVLQDVLTDNSDVLLRYDLQSDHCVLFTVGHFTVFSGCIPDVLADNSAVLLRYDLQPDQQPVILQYFLVVLQDVLADNSDVLLRYDLQPDQCVLFTACHFTVFSGCFTGCPS